MAIPLKSFSTADAWVVGDEPVIVIDISGMKRYAKPATKKVVKKTGKAKAGRKRR